MSIFSKIGNFAETWAKNTAEVSSDLRKKADEIDAGLANAGRNVQSRADEIGGQFKDQLTKNKFESTGAKIGAWLSKPVNLVLTIAAVFGLVWYAAANK